MPRLVYPIDPDGLLVDVVVGLRGLTTLSRLAAGLPVSVPVRARELIDTGTDVTAVSAGLLQGLAVAPSATKTTQTVGGRLSVQLFVISLGITDFGDPAASELVEPDLTIMELTTSLPRSIAVLVGLDVLRGCKFLLDGPANQFSLEF
jgi:hypothetical protein